MQDYNGKKPKKQGQKSNRTNLGFMEKLSEMLELPKEVFLGIPKMTLIGNSSLLVENCKGIVEFENEKIRLNTAKGLVKIQGEHLIIKEITSEGIIVTGEIGSLEFVE